MNTVNRADTSTCSKDMTAAECSLPTVQHLQIEIDQDQWLSNNSNTTATFEIEPMVYRSLSPDLDSDPEFESGIFSSMQLEPPVFRSLELEPAGSNDDNKPPALQDFRVLDLSVTDIADAGLSFLSAFSHIQSLNLFSTKVTDDGLEHVAKMEGLVELDLCGTEISDAGLARLEPLHKLEVLKVCGNKGITDAGASWLLTALKALTSLELRATSVSSECIQMVAEALALRTMAIR